MGIIHISQMLEICTALFMYMFKYMTVNYWTLGVFRVGPRCRPLAYAGKVSAAKVTSRNRDNLGSTVIDF